jgi:hypothetical protein
MSDDMLHGVRMNPLLKRRIKHFAIDHDTSFSSALGLLATAALDADDQMRAGGPKSPPPPPPPRSPIPVDRVW